MGAAWLIVAILAVAILLTILVVVMRRKKRKSRPAANADVFRALLNTPGESSPAADSTPTPANSPHVEKLRQNLRIKLLYQEDKIDRAIEIERERNPTGTLAELMQAAIERWERDNR